MPTPVRLVVCVNEKFGTGQKSCVGSGNLAYITSIRQLIEDHGLDVPIIERECLSKCEQGPVMRIAPGGKFFTEVDQNALTAIVEELKVMLTQADSRIV